MKIAMKEPAGKGFLKRRISKRISYGVNQVFLILFLEEGNDEGLLLQQMHDLQKSSEMAG